MRFAVCDDQSQCVQKTCKIINQYFADRNILCICDGYTSPHKLTGACANIHYDVIFLDVEMPEQNGIDAAAEIQRISPHTLLVFVSAFIEYAPIGYTVQAMRFLLKQQLDELLPDCLEVLIKKLLPNDNTIVLRIDGIDKKINLSDILYLEGAQHYVMIYRANSNSCRELTINTLYKLEQQLEKKSFLRIHKSFIVNMNYIANMSNYSALLIGGKVLPVSEVTFAAIRNKYVLWKGVNL